MARLILGRMNVEHIAPHFVTRIWPQVADMIAAALKHSAGEYSADQLKVWLTQGQQALLVATDDTGSIQGVATMAFENFPNAQIAFVTAISGRFISTQEAFDQLKQWAWQRGCTHIRGAARPSIARLWKQKFGFEQKYIIVEHTL